MTQPTSVDMTFDTSLVDVKPPTADINASFSTIESDQMNHVHVQLPKPIHHVPTQDAYNQWASVYDSDGNMLQAIDDLELATLLPDFLAQVLNTTTTTTNTSSEELHILDLGCGTARNTLKLLSHPFPASSPRIHIQGLDFSQPMLDIAATKLAAVPSVPGRTWSLKCCDIFSSSALGSGKQDSTLAPAHALISTLVLEHVPLDTFFTTLATLLQPQGMALVTNMHQDMGDKGSQAGFVNGQGVKVRGSSFVHTVEGMLRAAESVGLQVLDVREREVVEGDVQGDGEGDGKGVGIGKRGRKWVGVKVWVGMVVRKRGEGR